ncbi:MAG: type II toxin-antitoxin system RelE/ParE family toxin [Steroidobacteraceae bacterium]|jgi:plasmid stabilization system protein ParE|nr:type II toxin-antitoxin system RelE/ParE family toxin [Steroidobacteraceae bacterium]
MKRPLRLHGAALQEIRKATAWYRRRNPVAAARFAASMKLALASIRDGTAPMQTIPDSGLQRMILRDFPYQIIVEERLLDRQVVAISHQARAPGYWRTRVQR